jgi:hypothetical protein
MQTRNASNSGKALTVSARNIYHDTVIRALVADGWTITDDPLRLDYGGRNLWVDIGAERPSIAAEKNGEKIAVEVSSFVSRSAVRDLEEAVGQYAIYRAILEVNQPERQLYLAIPEGVYDIVLADQFGQLIIKRLQLRVLVFDDQQAKVLQWIS